MNLGMKYEKRNPLSDMETDLQEYVQELALEDSQKGFLLRKILLELRKEEIQAAQLKNWIYEFGSLLRAKDEEERKIFVYLATLVRVMEVQEDASFLLVDSKK